MITSHDDQQCLIQTVIKKEQDKAYIRWQNGCRLFHIAEPSFMYKDLAKTEQYVDFEELIKQNNIALFSETGSGKNSLLQDYQQYLKSKHIPWLWAKCTGWSQDSFLHQGFSEHSSKEFFLAITALGMGTSVGEKIHLLQTWLKSDPRPNKICLIISNLSLFSELNAENKQNTDTLLMALRQLYDDNTSGANQRLQTIIVDSSDRFYLEQPEFSSYLALSHQYRLPYWQNEDITQLADAYDISIKPESAERILDHTGGHPLLVQDCLLRLKTDGILDPQPRQIDQVARKTRLSPPPITKHWQNDLAEILRQNPGLSYVLRAYTQGETLGAFRFPPPADERPLFLAGWLAFNHNKRWGITSSLHAELARTVLDNSKLWEAK